MTPAVLPRSLAQQRLLVLPPDQPAQHLAFTDLPTQLSPGDVLVVNDAATLPASLPVTVHGVPCEARLVGPPEDGWVVLFGPGSWRQATEARPAPPTVHPGDAVWLGDTAHTVHEVSPHSPRLVRLSLTLAEVTAHGSPVQYSYVPRPLHLQEVQTPYARRPWATEMPSAGRVLTPRMVASIRARGAKVVALTHAAGLSSTGDPVTDALLPLPERYDIPGSTWAAVQAADRVIAVGTSVTRALESAAHGPLHGTTTLRIGPATTLQVVDALLSGMHEPGESHFEMMAAFAPKARLHAAVNEASGRGYHHHEFGDSTLLWRGTRAEDVG